MHLRTILALLPSLLPCFSFAQKVALPPHASSAATATGTVTGHVYCADTNSPARFASVFLEPAAALTAPAPLQPQNPFAEQPHSVPAANTALDGSFRIPNVRPGSYYLILQKQGYLSPLAQFTAHQLQSPSAEDRAKLAKALQQVTVEANGTSTLEVRLERGAAVSGTVRYDDGSPATGLPVRVLRRSSESEWADVAPTSLGALITDDRGSYRARGLATGAYLVEADLTVQNLAVLNLFGSAAFSSFGGSGRNLPVYAPGIFRRQDAVPLKLIQGEERTGEDIDIRLSKLHAISGTLTAQHDRHVINGGDVSLLDPEDRSEAAGTLIDTNGEFHFPFVPEGEYILKAIGRDVTRQVVAREPFVVPPTETRETVLHSYADREQPISVRGEISGMNVTLDEKEQPPASASQ